MNVAKHDAATNPYYLALGKFITKYSILETVVHWTLMAVTRTQPKMGQVLFSGTRISAAKDLINRTFEACGDPMSLQPRLKFFFDQVGLINSFRDEIVHHGASYQNDIEQIVFSNSRTAYVDRKLRSFVVTPELLDDLTGDTETAIFGLAYEVGRYSNTAEVSQSLKNGIVLPWRYKPPPLIAPAKNS